MKPKKVQETLLQALWAEEISRFGSRIFKVNDEILPETNPKY